MALGVTLMKTYVLKFIGLIIGLGVLPMFAFAAYNDVTLGSSDTLLTVGGVSITVAAPSAVLESIEVGSGTFTVVMPGNSFLRVTSSDRRTLSTPGTSITVTSSCTDSLSTYTFDSPAHLSAQTLTITVDAGTCTTGGTSGGSGGGGGGGGGGGSSSYTYVPPSSTPAPAAISAVTATPAVKAISGTIDRLLTKGMTSPGVKILQQLLNNDPDTRVVQTGPGSPGNESDFFGPATLKAVQKFQVKYGIAKPGASGYGNVGPLTRTILNSLAGKTASPTTAPAVSTPTVNGAGALGTISSRTLRKGVKNAEVRILQKILNSDSDTIIAETGDGSPGNETTFFGPATQKALKKFQEKHSIAKSGDEGYGNIGPKTRAKLNEIGGRTGGSDKQIEDAMQQIKVLQEQLKTTP